MTKQQERFLIFAISKTPRTYAKAAIVQCLAIVFDIKYNSVARVMGVSRQYVINCCKGVNVVPWEGRVERGRLTRYLNKKVKNALLPIRMFVLNGKLNGERIYILTTDGELPDNKCKILYKHYLGRQIRKNIHYTIRSKKYTEIDVMLTPYHNLTVPEILKHAK